MDHLLPLKLKIEVLRGRNLTASDVNGKSDPYCRVTLGNKTFSTTVQPNTLDPEWQQSVAFINDNLAPFATLQETNDTCAYKILLLGYLLIEIWDHDFGNPDDFIGRLVIPLSSLPLSRIESNKEQWHSLRRNSTSVITGEILLNIALESVEDDLCLSNDQLTNDYLIVSKALGYQLPVLINNKLIDYPGARESVEIGFSKVYVQQGPVSVEAMLLLTNYRLIILSTSDSRNNTNIPSNTSTATQPISNNDLNMWISLNNISSVERGGNSTVVRRHQVTGEAENVESTTLNINCYDCRHLQIVFVMSSEGNGVTVIKASDHPVPSKILQRVKRSRRMAMRHLKKLKGIKKKSSKAPANDRCRSGAFFEDDVVEVDTLVHVVTDTTPSTTTGPSLLEECSDIQQLDPGYNLVCSDESEQEMEEDKISPEPSDMIKDQIITDDDLQLAYNGLVFPVPTKLLVSSFILRLEDIAINVCDHPPAIYDWSHDQDWYKQESGRTSGDDSLLDKWDVNTVLCKDMQRVMNDKWRECAVNSQRYTLCSSYPRNIFIPAQVKSEPDIEEVAKFRSRGRVPSLVWLEKTTGSFVLRSAQPLTGTAGKHCKEDEQLIASAITCGPVGGGMTIFDARSFAAVQGNKLKGKGTEDPANYPGCRLVYLDIPNIHAVRDSYDAVKTLVFTSVSDKWLSSLESTQWLAYISLILKGAALIARYLSYQKGSALVHCSDGWDRTSQLTSLTQLMLDSYYRTIDGFMVLIDKEWLAYGHKFGDRLGHPLHLHERSPIFLQFLDCVHQMVHQHPSLFEFTEYLLLCIAEHINTRWFGTFLYNCDKERLDKHVFTRTVSLWSHVQAVKETFRNPQFYPTTETVIPSWTVRRLRLWDNYFLIWDNTVLPVIPSNNEMDMGAGLESDMIGTELPENNGQLAGDHTEMDTVVWMANDTASSCLMCHQKFTFTRRKHHCRNCGRIYCNDCSKHRLSLDHLGYTEPVRVCDNCFRVQTSIVTQQATNNLETHQEDGFQVFEVKRLSDTS